MRTTRLAAALLRAALAVCAASGPGQDQATRTTAHTPLKATDFAPGDAVVRR